MKNAFGLAGGAGGIEDEERMFGIEFFGGTAFGFLLVGVELLIAIVPPEIAPRSHGNFGARALIYDDVADVGAIFKRLHRQLASEGLLCHAASRHRP